LTAPADNPSTRNRCNQTKHSATGSTAMVDAAIRLPQSVKCGPLKIMIPGVSVRRASSLIST
jgi:hypothetical protein